MASHQRNERYIKTYSYVWLTLGSIGREDSRERRMVRSEEEEEGRGKRKGDCWSRNWQMHKGLVQKRRQQGREEKETFPRLESRVCV